MADELLKPVPIEETPFNAETPMQALEESLTPPHLFYVRNHFDLPHIDAETWRLTIDGVVERPLELSMEDLRSFPERTVTVTMECAGNGRTRMSPVPSGTPWAFGAVGSARFSGLPLNVLLDGAGLRPDAIQVLFEGADRGRVEPGRTVAFARGLPLEAARHPDVLLAWGMNGRPLLPEHGFPLRLVVPRWYGMASVKWLVRISARSAPFEGYFQRERYVYSGESETPEATPVTLARVRAVIGRPVDGAELTVGPTEVAGTAWSGAGPIARVGISVDDGRSWSEAQLGAALSPYAAIPWRFLWHPPGPGEYTVTARATDRAGNTQPLEPVWNAYGYGNNVVHRVGVTVRQRTGGA